MPDFSGAEPVPELTPVRNADSDLSPQVVLSSPSRSFVPAIVPRARAESAGAGPRIAMTDSDTLRGQPGSGKKQAPKERVGQSERRALPIPPDGTGSARLVLTMNPLPSLRVGGVPQGIPQETTAGHPEPGLGRHQLAGSTCGSMRASCDREPMPSLR